MGKKIIIPGANFSANGIAPEELELVVTSFGIDITNSNTFGDNNLAGWNRMRVMDNILIPNGSSITIKGLKGVDGLQTVLRLDYCYYNSENRSHSTVVGSYSNKVTADFYTLNEALNDEIVITNNYGQDYWFGICFKKNDNSDVDVSQYPLVYIV